MVWVPKSFHEDLDTVTEQWDIHRKEVRALPNRVTEACHIKLQTPCCNLVVLPVQATGGQLQVERSFKLCNICSNARQVD